MMADTAHYVARGKALMAWASVIFSMTFGAGLTIFAFSTGSAHTNRTPIILIAAAADLVLTGNVWRLLRRVAITLDVRDGQLHWQAPLGRGHAALDRLRRLPRRAGTGQFTSIPVDGQSAIVVWRTSDLRPFLDQLVACAPPQTR